MHQPVEGPSQWTHLRSAMADILSSHDDRCAAHDASSEHGLAALSDIEAGSSRLRESSVKISDGIASSIEREREALAGESDELSRILGRVEGLERRASDLDRAREGMMSRRRSAEASIPLQEAVASEVIAEADEIESRHVRNLPKIKRELSLHATMTNIKWDYSRSDALAGEVSVPTRAVHRRFVIDKGDLGEFEIAEKLWEMIEG